MPDEIETKLDYLKRELLETDNEIGSKTKKREMLKTDIATLEKQRPM